MADRQEQVLPRRHMDAYVTVPQGAALMGVSSRTFNRMLDQGLVPFIQPNVHRRVKRADVLAYRQSRAGNVPVILHETGSDDPLRD